MKKISRKSFLKLAAATAAGTAMAPALMGCAWPDTQDRTPYKGDIVLLLSNDIHSNLGTSKIMSTDGSTRITGGVARMAAAQAGVRHRAFGKTLTLDGGDYSQGTPYQDGYQKGWEILALAEMQVDFCTLGNHEFDVGDQAVENSWVNARKNRLRYGVYHKLPQLLVSNMFIKYNANGEPISYTSADIRPNDLSTNAFGARGLRQDRGQKLRHPPGSRLQGGSVCPGRRGVLRLLQELGPDPDGLRRGCQSLCPFPQGGEGL